MADKRIVMSPDSVLAILAGQKTMTRRLLKPQPSASVTAVRCRRTYAGNWLQSHRIGSNGWEMTSHRCPYYVGQRLWVAEALERAWRDYNKPFTCRYVADLADVMVEWDKPEPWLWQRNSLSAIFMPRWACRIFLEVTEVRAERLQGIGIGDVWREGLRRVGGDWLYGKQVCLHSQQASQCCGPTITAYVTLWDSLHKKPEQQFDANGWVDVVTFKMEEL